MYRIGLMLVACMVLSAGHALANKDTCITMDNTRMDSILNKHTSIVNGQPGYWEIFHKKMNVIVITDQKANRMRVVTPAFERKKLKKEHLEKSLSANFDTALDVKYALFDEYMWCIFVHPLKELTDAQLLDALDQVTNGAATFGTIYTSTNMVFGAGDSQKEEEKKK